VFGDTLENIMERQQKTMPDKETPMILNVLAEAILKLNGAKSEGIFRVPGDAEAVGNLRCQLDKNEFTLNEDIKDPNIPGSLLKLWLRELADPVIPPDFYEMCVAVGKGEATKSPAEVLQDAKDIINSIPGMPL
jgi:RhoGAP domain